GRCWCKQALPTPGGAPERALERRPPCSWSPSFGHGRLTSITSGPRSANLGRDTLGGRGAREEKTLHARAVSFAGFGEALISGPGLAAPPRASRPEAEAVEVEID